MRGENNKTQTKRVSLDIESEAYEKLKELQKLTGSSTIAGVFKNSLRLYSLFVTRQNEGFSLIFEKNNERQKVEIVI